MPRFHLDIERLEGDVDEVVIADETGEVELGFDLLAASDRVRKALKQLLSQAETAVRLGNCSQADQIYQRLLAQYPHEELAVSIDDAVRLDAAALAVQVFVGGENETKSIKNMTTLVDQGQAAGIPVLAVTAVGRDMVRDARYFRLATRISAELGASFVKTYYVEDGFETVTSACPVPIVIAGGKKVEEKEALRVAYRAIQEGAAGVDMGRNVFQSESPAAMLSAVRGVVHDGLTPDEAFDLFETLSH